MKRVLSRLLLTASLLVAAQAQADTIDAIYTGFFSNEAIRGYDSVAYFTVGEPVKGSDDFTLEYMGALWKFASQENLDLFEADPEAYAPQYGGYCAYAVSQGTTASAEPELFTIHDGKLYLNYSRRINRRWLADKEEFIAAADQQWPAFELEE